MKRELSRDVAHILAAWLPLCLNWLLLLSDYPLVVLAIGLGERHDGAYAAYGGIAYPAVLFLSTPLVHAVAAVAKLSTNRDSLVKVAKYLIWIGLLITGAHLALLTLFLESYVLRALHIAEASLRQGWLALLILSPSYLLLAIRGLAQGVLIRTGYSGQVAVGALVKLVVMTIVFLFGHDQLRQNTLLLACASLMAGKVCEAAYTVARVRKHSLGRLRVASGAVSLSWRGFAAFYGPLCLTAMMVHGIQPLISAGMSRSPLATMSHQAWPACYGTLTVMMALGYSFQDVVLATLENRPGAHAAVRLSAVVLTVVVGILAFGLVSGPISRVVMRNIFGLQGGVLAFAGEGIVAGVLLPPLIVIQSWLQALALVMKRTELVAYSMGAFLAVGCVCLSLNVGLQLLSGLEIALVSLSVATLARVLLIAAFREVRASAVRESVCESAVMREWRLGR